MKKTGIAVLMAIALAVIAPQQKVQAQVGVNVDFNTFYTELTPYGRWMDNPTYGRVWICNEPGFQPYSTAGHWVYTDEGWTWVSDYPWGWAPFHYGRWAYDDGTGWFWVPGYEWAPAWVSWRNSNDYYGWAPLSPGLHVSVGASFGSIPASRWVFVPRQYIASPMVRNYYVNNSRNVTIIHNTTIINNVHVVNNSRVNYVAGPRREEVERVSHTTIRPASFATAARPGRTVVNNNTINVYRPTINRTVVNNNAHINNTHVNNTHVNNNVPNGNNTRQPQPGRAPGAGVRPAPQQQQPAVRPATPQQQHPQQPANRPVPQQRPVQHGATPQQHMPPHQAQPAQHPHPAPQPHPQPQHTQPQPRPAPQQHPPHAEPPRPAPQQHEQPMPRPAPQEHRR